MALIVTGDCSSQSIVQQQQKRLPLLSRFYICIHQYNFLEHTLKSQLIECVRKYLTLVLNKKEKEVDHQIDEVVSSSNPVIGTEQEA
jgi:hypothetical protein